MCSEFAIIDQLRDFREILTFDVDQKEDGFDAVALSNMLIRLGNR
jgi:hypothetical protein